MKAQPSLFPDDQPERSGLHPWCKPGWRPDETVPPGRVVPVGDGAHAYSPPPSNGTDTSKAAARLTNAQAGRAVVLAYLERRGAKGATDEELAYGTGLDGNTVRPRRNELAQAGQIVRTEERRPTKSGRSAAVWRIKP